MLNSVMHSGTMTIYAGMARLDSSAQEIARQSFTAPASTVQGQPTAASQAASEAKDLTEPLIEQHQALYEVQAGAKVITTANKTLGTVLDMFA
ncbi:MAG: hypothetical protein U1F42_01435 [Candidatus Competibacteraceae bacterium]